MFEEIFVHKKLVIEKLLAYGFVSEGAFYVLNKKIKNGAFTLFVIIASDGSATTKLIENENNEEYILYKTDAEGAFVGEIRAEIGEVLEAIATACYETAVFKQRQAQVVIDFVRKTYGDELEFLWKKFSDSAIVRRKDNKKWYGALLFVQKNKLGFATSELVEILDLRVQPDEMASLLEKGNYYPGWHMNKKSWYTIILDDSVTDEEICLRIEESYRLAVK